MEAALDRTATKPNLIARMKTLSLFRRKRPATSAWNVIAWWESRRIAYNLIVGGAGIVSCILVGLLVFTTPAVQNLLNRFNLSPGFEIFFVIIYGIAANIFYTFGWIAELVVRSLWPEEAERFGTTTFTIGLGFSLLLTIAPGVMSLAIEIVIGIARLAGIHH